MEKSLVIIKPDAIQRGLAGEILNRFEKKGLKLIGLKMVRIKKTILAEHYAHVKDQPFFQELANYMSTSPVLVVCLEGLNAIKTVRGLAGTNNNQFGTIRGDFASSPQRNLIHSSDSAEMAEREIKRFFPLPEDLFQYEKDEWKQVYSLSDQK